MVFIVPFTSGRGNKIQTKSGVDLYVLLVAKIANASSCVAFKIKVKKIWYVHKSKKKGMYREIVIVI